MTKQEAIKDIQDNIKPIVGGKSLDMAIEALTHFNSTSNSIKNELNELSCSEKPNRSEPKTSENGSLDSEMPEIKTDRTIGGMIYRQDAIDAVKRNTFRLTFAEEQNCEGHVAWSAEAVYSDVMEGELLALPSAQPERKKGEWIQKPNIYGVAYCSECDYELHTDNTNFCPNCGCQMGGENNV